MIELGCVSALFSLSNIIWLDDRRRPLSSDLRPVSYLSLGGTLNPLVTREPDRSLGTIFDGSLKDSAAIKQINDGPITWLTLMDRSDLSAKFKGLIYQHGVLLSVLWPTTVGARGN